MLYQPSCSQEQKSEPTTFVCTQLLFLIRKHFELEALFGHVSSSLTHLAAQVETSSDVKSTLSHFQHHCIHKMIHWSKNAPQDSNLTNDFPQFSLRSWVGNEWPIEEREAWHVTYPMTKSAAQMAKLVCVCVCVLRPLVSRICSGQIVLSP